jgi:hypothetical protein
MLWVTKEHFLFNTELIKAHFTSTPFNEHILFHIKFMIGTRVVDKPYCYPLTINKTLYKFWKEHSVRISKMDRRE